MIEGANHCNQGVMAAVNTDTTLFQKNISKLSRPLETADLEELPDSRERTGAPVLCLSSGCQIDVWEMFFFFFENVP